MDKLPVEDASPSPKLTRLVNPVLSFLLRSPLHGLLSKHLMLLTVTGRKTGRSYTILVGRHQLPDGSLVLSTGGNWRHNLHGGADVRVLLDGHDRAGRAVLEEDPNKTAEVFKVMLEGSSPKALAVKINLDRPPTAAELKPALADRGIAYLELRD